MNANRMMVDALAGSRTYQDFERAFTGATGLPLTLRPMEHWQLALQGQRKANPFCEVMARKNESCAGCLQVQERVCREAATASSSLTCPHGLVEIAVPVRVGDTTVAFLQTGQVFPEKPTKAQFAKVADTLARQGHDLPAEQLEALYFASPVVPLPKLESARDLLVVFADHLALRSNQITLQSQSMEPPVITRAKQFIRDHIHENLTLDAVAKSVNTSRFYFCKLFRRATGIHFTEYVNRLRVEKAKELLLNRNLRVSEVAYDVGFQSLTHFNRVFRKLMGESPTLYRSHLPRASAARQPEHRRGA
ncbi:MAG: helix-turn-helix domain-containing protein [Verrucomicrobia bacterium]|nr:helix-turn-helix domain-containing protein [Verrucomicrobiota bacterium]